MDKELTGQFITELRKEKGLTQKQLADLLNVTDKAVSKWERGLSFPDISMLEPISQVLDVSVMELLAGKRRDTNEIMTIEEAQRIVSQSVELGDEELRRKKERSRFIIRVASHTIFSDITLAICGQAVNRPLVESNVFGLFEGLFVFDCTLDIQISNLYKSAGEGFFYLPEVPSSKQGQ